MTVQELCDRLSKFPPDTPVVVKGYEGGFNDVNEIELLEMQLNVNTIWFYGAHGANDHQHELIEGIAMTPVVYLHGVNHIADEDWHNR
jgi:hypothetical protein